jgi:uncharacterized BrkB/YihY/UPF0761 family membrane protein
VAVSDEVADEADGDDDPGHDPGHDPGQNDPDHDDPGHDDRGGRIAAGRRATARLTGTATSWFEDQRRRRPLVDLVQRFARRDGEAAGGVLGSAVAFRIFLLVAPLVLALVGAMGFLVDRVSSEDATEAVGVSGELASQIRSAFEQSSTARWVALLTGLVGTATAGRSLTKVLVVASALAWRQGDVRPRAQLRVVASVVSLMAGVLVIAALINRVRAEAGVGVAATSVLAAGLLYGVGWFLTSLLLPRATSDPTALLPGAVLVATTATVLQWGMQFYLPDRVSQASELYGSLGLTLATLGVFFLFGRVLVAAMVLDAVVWERFGSIATFVFGLPGLRALPRRAPRVARYFGLDPDGDEPGDP